MATDERFPSKVDSQYRVSGAGAPAVSGPGRDDAVMPTLGGSRADLSRRDGQEGEQPGGGTLLAGFLDELVKLRADFERRLAGIEQALLPQMPGRPACV